MKDAITLLLSLFVGIFLGMMLTRSCSKQKETITEIVKTDTLTIVKVDTNRYDKPKAVSEIITGIDVSFQPYAFLDIEDSSGVNLNSYLNSLNLNLNSSDVELYNRWVKGQGQTFYHTIKLYQDSTYRAQVSGINANLDFIEVYPKTITKYITNTERVVVEPKKWGLYGNAEYRFTSVDSRLCIGAELRYTAPKVEYFIKGGRELIRNQSYIEVGANIPIVRW